MKITYLNYIFRDVEIQWIKYSIQREICFKRIVGFDIDVIQECQQQFNATLFLISLHPIKILIYDSNQLENEYVISQLSFKEHLFPIDIYKDELQILSYVKLYCNADQRVKIFQLFDYKFILEINLAKDILTILLFHIQHQQQYKINKIQIQQCEQWNQISFQFQATNIILYIHLNGQQYKEIITLEQFYIKYSQTQLLEYKCNTYFEYYNSQAIYDKLLVIQKLTNETQNFNFCDPSCQICLGFQCLEYCKNGELLNKINQRCQKLNDLLLNDFLNQNDQEYANLFECQNCPVNHDFEQCKFFPNKYGNYDLGCQYQQLLFQDVLNQLDIQQNIRNDFEFKLIKYMQADLILYDFDRFAIKTQDIFLTYYDMKQLIVYCEFGYHQNQGCKKNVKQCWFQNKNCILCHQKYSFFKNKCVKCQKNCLACTIIDKKIKCILFIDNYFIDNRGFLKKCNLQLNVIICQDKEVIIQNLLKTGYEVCQYSIYQIENNKCMNSNSYRVNYDIIEYPNYISIIESKLEIQDIILVQNMQEFQNKEILFLINLQQTLKLIKLLKENKLLESSQNTEKHSQFLQLMGIQDEDLIQKKITLDVKIFLGSHLEYQNHVFREPLDLYNQLQLFNFKQIQYNMVIKQKFPEFNSRLESPSQYKNSFQYVINYENYENTSFIFNITFQLSTRIIFQDCHSFYFKANKVILSNITFINQSDYEPSCNQYGGITISAQDIRIHNLNFQKLQDNQIFEFLDFVFLQILNLQIYESNLQQFINAKSFKKYNLQSIDIQNILRFIRCQDAQNAQIRNIFIYQSEILDLFIQMKGEFKTITIDNIQFVEATMFQSILFHFESTQIKDSKFTNNITIQDVFVSECSINRSVIFDFQQIRQLKLSHIYVSNSEFNSGLYLQFNKYFLNIDNLHINRVVMIDSTFIMFQGMAIDIELVFIQLNFSQSSFIFNFFTGDVYLQNIHLKINKLNQTTLLNIKSQEIILNKIIITNQSSFSVIENCFSLIEIQSILNEYIHIQNIRFKNLRIIDSVILMLSTENRLTLEKISIINVELIIRQVKQLIQLNLGQKILDEIYIINTSVNAQVDEYSFLLFRNEIEMIDLFQLSMINLKNQYPKIDVFFIKNEFAQLRINRMFAKNLSNIKLIISESCSFNIINGKLFNIENQRYNFPSIICQVTSDKILKNTVIMYNIQLNNFSNSFIRIYSISAVIVQFHNIHFKESNLLGSVFIVEQQQSTKDYYKYISINNINITNTNHIQVPNQQFIFYINAYFVLINQINIHNINQQFLLLTEFRQLFIKNVYIANIQSNKFLELRSNISKQVIIYNFFIQNSKSFMDSLFKLMLTQDYTLIRQIRILNIKVKNEIFCLHFQKQTQSIISDLIIKNVISQNRIFYCTQNIYYYQINIINTFQLIIFQNQGTTRFSNGLITNIYQEAKLSESHMIIINGSEIVNSNIIQDELKLQIQQSLFEGNFNRQDQIIKLYISLNQGAQMFKYKNLTENLFQVRFDDDNNYLYLPSGRDIQSYRYFYFKTQQYRRLYDSISFVNIQQGQQIQCILSQSIDNNTIVQKQINVKPGVNLANNLIFILNPNQKDKHIQMDLNCSQNGQFINYRTLIKTFNCQLGEYLYQDQCLECNIEQQLYSVGYNQEHCLYMDSKKIQELKLGIIKLNLYYWRFSYANKYIEWCTNENCLGGWQTGDQSCKIGYIGAICQECDINNIRGDGNYGKIDDLCYLCYFDQKLYFKGLFLIMYQLILVCISYYSNKQQSQQYLFLRISQRKFTEIILKQNVNQATILLKLYYNYLFTIFILKDLINFGDVGNFSLNFIYNPNIIALPQFDCFINSLVPIPIQYTQLLYKIIVPLLLFNIAIILYVILIKFSYIKYSIYIIIVILYTLYQQNQIIIIQSLIKLSSKVKYSNIYWTLENLAVQYQSKLHQHYMYVLIIPLILFFTLIFIFIFYWIRIINQRTFNNLKLSLFICKQYKSQFTFWDQIRLSYIYFFMFAYYILDNYYIILIVLTLITIIIQLEPFQLRNLNRIDLLIYAYSTYTYLAILIIQKDRQYLSSFIVITSNLILLKTYLNHLQHGLNIQFTKIKIRIINLFIQYIPYQKYIIQIDKYEKNKYYYQLFRESRKKSNNSVTGLFQSVISKQNKYASFEVELSAINQRSIK